MAGWPALPGGPELQEEPVPDQPHALGLKGGIGQFKCRGEDVGLQIDLIPDFIPVLGYLDDLVLVPLGIWLALKMIPPEVMADARARAAASISEGSPTLRAGICVVIILWLLALASIAWIIWRATR